MKMTRHILCVAALLGAASAALACDQPQPPALPDGASADRDAMVSAHGEVKSFVNSGNAYLECLQQEEAAEVANESITEDSRKVRLAKYNATVEAMQKIGADFNVELKKFNAKQQ